MKLAANGISLEVEDHGSPQGEPLLLVMGLGMQLTAWPDELVQMLVARGFRVIRFDNRDAGLSQGFDALGVPNLPLAAMKYALHLPIRRWPTMRPACSMHWASRRRMCAVRRWAAWWRN
jgi:pimeloyl-ACP methyl ester carboxylesterase